MLVSVYTPTHYPDYLTEAWASLKAQTHTDWEWVLVPNGENGKVPEQIASDPRVKVRPMTDSRIGGLKSYAVENCRGELLVEMDHDDLLLPTCLEKLVAAAAKEPGPAFFYSDSVNFFPDGRSETFIPGTGWEYYPFKHEDKVYQAIRSFPVTARSLCEIEFCPNHVRCWSRQAYIKAGGYNAALLAGDDHDLICRTYLNHVAFRHVPEVLYMYRRHPRNSFETPVLNELIHRQSIQNLNTYLFPLIHEWCTRESLQMFDLGGAHNCPPGYIPIDMNLPDNVPGIKADVLDKNTPLWTRIPEGTAGVIRGCDFFEHIPSPNIPELMNDIYKCLAHGGWLLTQTPCVCAPDGSVGWGAYRDPTHVSFWVPDSWRYYTEANLARFLNGRVQCRFQEVRVWIDFPSAAHAEERCPYIFADLCAAKGRERLPGGLRI